jgi:hypothetical protein
MHPFLRAYMAGIALPTIVVPIVVAALAMTHSGRGGSDLERILIFPVGLAPNAWGLWNIFYLWIRRHRELPIGLFGMVLVVIIAPAAFGLQVSLGRMVWTRDLFAVGFPLTLVIYYLAWKHVVARLNDLLGIG